MVSIHLIALNLNTNPNKNGWLSELALTKYIWNIIILFTNYVIKLEELYFKGDLGLYVQ